MAIVTMVITVESDIKKVWETVTSLTNYHWRRDLSRIEVLNENQFIECTKDGYATTFTITKTEPYQRWEFDMENDNMKGHWTGIFSEEVEGCTLRFTEDVIAKKVIMRPFLKGYLKKQQAAYMEDLKRALEENK